MDILYDYAMRWVGTPYVWGGQSHAGMDCSGFVQILLESVGEQPPKDMTAQSLYDWFSSNGRATFNRYGLGSLVFFGADAGKITHVAMMLDQYRIIHATGGGRDTKTPYDAVRNQAFVKITLLGDDKRRVAGILKPHYSRIGMI